MARPMTSPSVVVVGSVALDDLHLPSGSFTDVVGGAATFCATAASLFTKVGMVGVVGEDFPEQVLGELAARGVDTQGVERAKGRTFKWAGKYADNLASRETLDTQLNVFADFRPRLPPAFAAAPFVLLGNIHPALQLDVLAQCNASGSKERFVAADTMNLWIDIERPRLAELLAQIDCLVVNDEELRQLAGTHNIRAAAAAVRAMGPPILVCKRGEYGSLLFLGDDVTFVPAYPLETELDPTGAGDTFAGSLLGYLANAGRVDAATFKTALVYATAVASYCVEGVGLDRVSKITSADVDARVAAIRALSH